MASNTLNNVQASLDTIKTPLTCTNDNTQTEINETSSSTIKPEKDNENEYCDVDIIDDIQYSASSPVVASVIVDCTASSIIGKIVDKFDKNTKDGQIGATKQRGTGDCWLLSGVNALSYTEKGREIIKNSLEYNDGYTTVNLEGVGKYIVEDKELELVKSQIIGSKQYSTGDDDMLIFELAVEKVRDDIANGNLALYPDPPQYLHKQNSLTSTEEGNKSSTNGGNGAEAMYYLTGETTNYYFYNMEKKLLAFQSNDNKDIAMTADTQEESTVLDINGKKVKIAAHHVYAIKKVEDDIVTLTNPWNSSKEIQLSKDAFLEAFHNIDAVNLSWNDDSDRKLYSKESKLNNEGDKVFIFHDKSEDDYENIREVKYSSKGNPLEMVVKEDGHTTFKNTYDPQDSTLIGQIQYHGVAIVQLEYDKETHETTEQVTLTIPEYRKLPEPQKYSQINDI